MKVLSCSRGCYTAPSMKETCRTALLLAVFYRVSCSASTRFTYRVSGMVRINPLTCRRNLLIRQGVIATWGCPSSGRKDDPKPPGKPWRTRPSWQTTVRAQHEVSSTSCCVIRLRQHEVGGNSKALWTCPVSTERSCPPPSFLPIRKIPVDFTLFPWYASAHPLRSRFASPRAHFCAEVAVDAL